MSNLVAVQQIADTGLTLDQATTLGYRLLDCDRCGEEVIVSLPGALAQDQWHLEIVCNRCMQPRDTQGIVISAPELAQAAIDAAEAAGMLAPYTDPRPKVC